MEQRDEHVETIERQDGVGSGKPVPLTGDEGCFLPPIPELIHIESQNIHTYNPEVTARSKKEEAENTPAEERTPEQVQLLEDVKYMDRYCFDGDFSRVFTPEELHGLAEKFRLLEKKHRPDFNGVESRIVDFLADEISEVKKRGEENKDSDMVTMIGIVRRAERDAENRRGMNFDTLEKAAAIASRRLESKIGNSHKFPEYSVHVMDPKGREVHNLRKTLQFVADDYVLEVIGKRVDAVTGPRQDAFVANAEIINQWFQEARDLIDQIPADLRIRDGAVTANARHKLISLIDTMNARLNSTDTRGHTKDFRVDPVGAINLQKRIAYTVAEINKFLSPEAKEEIIEPLE